MCRRLPSTMTSGARQPLNDNTERYTSVPAVWVRAACMRACTRARARVCVSLSSAAGRACHVKQQTPVKTFSSVNVYSTTECTT